MFNCRHPSSHTGHYLTQPNQKVNIRFRATAMSWFPLNRILLEEKMHIFGRSYYTQFQNPTAGGGSVAPTSHVRKVAMLALL
jgi:hypothetical protein